MSTYGERFAEAVGDYLIKNKLVNADGRPSLGRINAKILAELADRFEQAERRRDKAERTKKLSKAERDKLFEALATGTGSNPTNMTEAELRRCAVSLAAIIRATPDVAPDDILEACRQYKGKMNGATISTSAVSNNWSKLYQPKTPSRSSPGESAVPEPEDWRGLMRDDPEDGWAVAKQWEEILPFYQSRIARKVARIKAGRP